MSIRSRETPEHHNYLRQPEAFDARAILVYFANSQSPSTKAFALFLFYIVKTLLPRAIREFKFLTMESIIHIQGSLTSPLTPLFLIHAVSGLALPYFALPTLSPHLSEAKARAVYGISSPIYDDDLPHPYRLPKSIRDIASQYIDLIQENVQPEGPYLLGGWSMGGMIALKMAEILRQRGERVLHVIMIDSGNPRHYPDFVGEWERDMVIKGTYNAVAGRLGARLLPITLGGDIAESEGLSDDEYKFNSSNPLGLETPDSSDAEDEDEEEDCGTDSNTASMLKQMLRHVTNGINLIGKIKHTELVVPASTSTTLGTLPPTPPLSRSSSFHSLSEAEEAIREPDTYTGPVTLLKCTMSGKVNPMLSHERRHAMHKFFTDERIGWSEEELPNLRIAKIHSTHDGCFDPSNVTQTAERIRRVLRTVY